MPSRERRTQIVGADMSRDGVTTCVTLEHMGRVIRFTVRRGSRLFPFFLMPCFILISERGMFGRARRLLPWGRTETYYVTEIARATVRQLGIQTVRDHLKRCNANPYLGSWNHVLAFLRIVQRARLRNVLSKIEHEQVEPWSIRDLYKPRSHWKVRQPEL